jgi:hypothetical protein
VSSQADTGSAPTSPARGIAAQIVANTSLLIAVLVYMGWAYDDAFYGYFHLNPLDLNLSIVEYMLQSLHLFSITIILVAVLFIAAAAVRSWGLGKTKFARLATGTAAPRMLIWTGAVLTLAAFVFYFAANYVAASTYLFLLLLGGGVLLLTWPTRTDRRGRFAYAMAIMVSAVCALWAAALYAHNLGLQTAKKDAQDLSTRTAVAVYSIDRLALSGPGLTIQVLPAGYHYHYVYRGLRLLLAQSGTYYLLPIYWSPKDDFTYILDQGDPIRIELGGG